VTSLVEVEIKLEDEFKRGNKMELDLEMDFKFISILEGILMAT
jgi:hypothetical protein